MPCLNDPSKLQVRANNKEALQKSFEEHKVPLEDRTKITELFDGGKMDNIEVKNKCIGIRPYMSELFETWSGSEISDWAAAGFKDTELGV